MRRIKGQVINKEEPSERQSKGAAWQNRQSILFLHERKGMNTQDIANQLGLRSKDVKKILEKYSDRE